MQSMGLFTAATAPQQLHPGATVRSFRKTRIAPTPSGYLHLGNILSFALTATLADRYGASVLLRIDDMDRQRANPQYIQDIFDTLYFLELPWQEGPCNMQEFEREYSQVHRLELYNKALETLQERDALFVCNCSRSDILKASADGHYTGACRHKAIALHAPETVWRLITEDSTPVQVKEPGRTLRAALPLSMQYFVLRKKDGFPAYQLSSLLDDLHYGVDLIVRGADLWPSTLAQQYLARTLGSEAFSQATFFHHTLLLAPQGDKLSKSAGATSIQHLRKEGFTPAQIYSLIAQQAGLYQPVRNWKELGELLLTAGSYSPPEGLPVAYSTQ